MKKASLIFAIGLLALASCKKDDTQPNDKSGTPTPATPTTPTHQVKYELKLFTSFPNTATPKKSTYLFDYYNDNNMHVFDTLVVDTVITSHTVIWSKTVNISEGKNFYYRLSEMNYTDLPNYNASIQMNIYIDGLMNMVYHGTTCQYYIVGTPDGHNYLPHEITGTIYDHP